jgi:hypothetical protein
MVSPTALTPFSRPRCLGLAAAFLLAAAVPSVLAAAPSDITLELNKLEPTDIGCRVYIVLDNRSESAFSAFRLDLILFQPDGVIGKRLTLDLAPVKPKKRLVKAFDIDKTKCDGIGSVLVNDAPECRTEAGPVENCLDRVELKSLAAVQLSK